MDQLDEVQIADAAALLRDAHHVMVLTGAGISAESGIPTFRDTKTGLWMNYRPEDFATPDAFAADPRKVTQWYDERRVKVLECQPNPGHMALVALEKSQIAQGRKMDLFTQNVDRLHQRAGSRNVQELHGALESWRCTRCGKIQEEWGGPLGLYPPVCECGGMRRPDIVWFGEALPIRVLDAAQQALMCCDLFISVGTSGQVYPAAGLIDQAILSGTPVIEINAEPTAVTDHVCHHFRGKAGEILPALVQALGR